MVDYVQMHASLHPTRAAVTDLTFGLAWTYQELNQFIGQTATVLQELGVETGARVACLAKNRAEFIALQFACARLGAIFVPLNWRLSGEELSVVGSGLHANGGLCRRPGEPTRACSSGCGQSQHPTHRWLNRQLWFGGACAMPA